MDRKKAGQMAAVLQAFADGRPVQYRSRRETSWHDSPPADSDSGMAFDFSSCEYRITPQPKRVRIDYVPGTDQMQAVELDYKSLAGMQPGAKSVIVELPQ